MQEEPLMTPGQVALWLGISVSTIYSMSCRRRLPAIHLSAKALRFRRSEIEAWLAERSTATGAPVPHKSPMPSGKRRGRARKGGSNQAVDRLVEAAIRTESNV